LEILYGRGGSDVVVAAGAEALDAMRVLQAADPLRYRPASGVQYPRSELGRQLQQVAQLIKADVGLRVAFADTGGWDTHVNQGAAEGQLAQRLGDLGRSLAAFARDLDARLQDVVLVTLSEFGRTVQENGSGGTDHGHANVSFVLGGMTRGGTVAGRWPGLAVEQRFEGRDLAVTTDFRSLLSEIAEGHFGVPSDGLFPGYRPDPGQWLGLFGPAVRASTSG